MRVFKLMILGVAIWTAAFTAHAGEGLPLPWPFPWAKDCPIDWQSLEGRYALSDSSKEEQIEVSVHVTRVNGFRMVRVSRYSQNGQLLAEGFNFITQNQRTISLVLHPLDLREATMSAVIKLYYQSSNRNCGEQNLVPIMSVEKRGSNTTGTTSYRLIKLEE